MSEERDRAIGVFDSGVGGLTVVREIARRLPGEEIVYFGDTARVPYGTKSPGTVLRFAREDLEFLKTRGVKMIVVACNTVSAVAFGALEREEELPLVGVLEPGARAAAGATRSGRIAVIGTMATIRSQAYEAALRRLRPGLEIVSLPCPLFVSLAEEGWVEGEVAEAVARRYLGPLAGSGVDTLVLGCTHYPLLKDVIARVMGDGVVLVDSAEQTASDVVRALEERGLRSGRAGGGRIGVCLSDVPYRCREICERFLGRPIESVEQVAEHAGTERNLAWHDTTAGDQSGCGR